MPAYQHVTVPSGGQKITVNNDFQPERSRPADHSLYRRRRNRSRHHAGDDQGGRCRGRQGLWRQAQDPLDGNLRGREVHQGVRPGRLAARRDARDPQGLRGFHQGPADDAGRRRHPQAERRAAPAARSVRLPAAGAVLRGRPESGQGAGKGQHGDLPREFGRHLRGHRVGRGVGRRQEADQVPRSTTWA